MKYLKENFKDKNELFELLDKLFAEIFERLDKIEKILDEVDEWEL